MYTTSFVSFLFASSVLAAAPSPMSSGDAHQTCQKACQVAPSEQQETCMRVCMQFAEQGVAFTPAVTATAATAAATPASSSSKHPATSKPSGSLLMAASATSKPPSQHKSKGEDNDEDGSSGEDSSMSSLAVSLNAAPLAITALVLSVLF